MSMFGAGVLEQQGAAAGGFNPITDLNLTYGFWVEGTNAVAEGWSDEGTVGTWPDEVGSQDATWTGSVLQPTYESAYGYPTARPAIDFGSDASVDGFDFTISPTLTQPITVFAIAYSVSSSNFATLFRSLSKIRLSIQTAGSQFSLYAGSTPIFSMSDGPIAVVGVFNTTASVGWFNGTNTTALSVGTNAFDDTPANIGYRPASSSQGWKGAISFLGIEDGVASSDDITAFNDWAADHYGMTIA